MMENIQLISCDIDGTIVDKTREIKKETADKIEELRNHGYLFGLASGRPARDILDNYKKWNLSKQFDFIIGWNGGELYDDSTKEITNYNFLKKEWLKEIVDIFENENCGIHMYYEDKYISNVETDRAWYSAFRNKREFIVTNDLSKFYQKDNGGIMIRYDVRDDAHFQEIIKQMNSKKKGYIGFNTQDDLIEFANVDCNKGVALKAYCKNHSISLDKVMAFGDTTNDNEMLKCCHGVCLFNGTQDTKKCAEFITELPVDKGGFIDFVDKNLL